jgi:hypothetical protein
MWQVVIVAVCCSVNQCPAARVGMDGSDSKQSNGALSMDEVLSYVAVSVI